MYKGLLRKNAASEVVAVKSLKGIIMTARVCSLVLLILVIIYSEA